MRAYAVLAMEIRGGSPTSHGLELHERANWVEVFFAMGIFLIARSLAVMRNIGARGMVTCCQPDSSINCVS